MKERFQAIDWMRGIVMLIMVTDHASSAFNAGRTTPDSALFDGWNEPLVTAQYLFRWCSHLCAPVFVFLAGTSLALSIDRRRQGGATAWSIDRDLSIRGTCILAAELFYVGLFWNRGFVLLQVLFAIGASMWLMIGLRRLPSVALASLAIAVFVVGEWTHSGQFVAGPGFADSARAVLIDAGILPHAFLGQEVVMAVYPVLPWCAIMVFGWIFGRALIERRAAHQSELDVIQLVRPLAILGTTLLAGFALLRWNDGFGNLGLHRTDDSILRWLQVSKYPPSLCFVALELGIMFVILAMLFRIEAWRGRISSLYNPVLVFGQTAFFFYVAHIFLLETGAELTDLRRSGDLRTACLASVGVLAVLYPLCLGYRMLKSRYPRSVLRFF